MLFFLLQTVEKSRGGGWGENRPHGASFLTSKYEHLKKINLVKMSISRKQQESENCLIFFQKLFILFEWPKLGDSIII